MFELFHTLAMHLSFLNHFWHFLQSLIPRPIQGLLFLLVTYYITTASFKLSKKTMAGGQLIGLTCISLYLALDLLLPQRYHTYIPAMVSFYLSAVLTYVVHKMFDDFRELPG